MTGRLALPPRRNHIIQEVKIAGLNRLYLSVHNDKHPAGIFLRVKGLDCSSELIGLYDGIARLMSLALQYDATLEKGSDPLTGVEFESYGPIGGHDCLMRGASRPDLAGRHLLGEFCSPADFAHSQVLSWTDWAR